jgi:hypothetical protein
MTFKYKLGEKVEVEVSGEAGIIVGRAEYTTAESNYFLRYKATDGRAVEAWWSEESLKSTA